MLVLLKSLFINGFIYLFPVHNTMNRYIVLLTLSTDL